MQLTTPCKPRSTPATPHRCPYHGSLAWVAVGEAEHRLYVLKAEKIDWIESQGDYVKFRCGGSVYISRDTGKRLAPVLAERLRSRPRLPSGRIRWVRPP
jgi:hypothetical protein